MKSLSQSIEIIILIAVIAFSIYSSLVNLSYSNKLNTDNSLVLLADQLIHGHISLKPTTTMPIGDIAKYNGKYYLYFGIFPSLLLIPLAVLFSTQAPQIIIGVSCLIVSFFAIYSIAKRFKYSNIDSLWLSVFYVFSTVLLSSGIINISSYQVDVLGSTLLLLAVREYVTRKRPVLIGIFLAAAITTRPMLILAALFFIIEIYHKRLTLPQCFRLFVPVVFGCLIVGIYNMLRFHSPLDSGYAYNITLHTYPLTSNLIHGFMSIRHIPANLYAFFLMSPLPILERPEGFVLKFPYLKASPWGMAIWHTSPLFLILLTHFRSSRYTKAAALTVIAFMIPIFSYYGIGFSQFGFRYALDFLPFLFLLLLPSLGARLSTTAKLLIIVGVIFNGLYIPSLWDAYPLFNIFK